jgi:hypothetical protein
MNLPKSWNDISIGQYIELYPVFKNPDTTNPYVDIIRKLSVLTGKPIQEVEKLKLGDYASLHAKLAFTNEPLPTEFPPQFKVKEDWYEVITDVRTLNGSQYMSTMMILNNAPEGKEERKTYMINNLHYILTSVLKPVEKKKLIFKEKEVPDGYMDEKAQELYDSMPISIAYPITLFFYTIWTGLTPIMQGYSKKKLKKNQEIIDQMDKELKKHISKGGVGMQH